MVEETIIETPQNQLLKEIDSNTIEEYQPLETDEDTNGTFRHTTALSKKIYAVDLATRKEIIRRWLKGDDSKDIGHDYGISTRTVNLIVETNDKTRLDIEKRYFAVVASRENFKVAEVKDEMIDYVRETLRSARDEDMPAILRLKTMNNVAAMLDKLDHMSRLNQDKATQISKTTNTNINIDLVQALKEFKTPEDKLRFLQSQAAHLKQTQHGNA